MDSLYLSKHSPQNEYNAPPVVPPAVFSTPPSGNSIKLCSETPESILRKRAETFSTPSIIRKRRNGVQEHETSCEVVKVDNGFHGSNKKEIKHNADSGHAELCESPSTDGIVNTKAFNASPSYMLTFKRRKTRIKSVEKQLDFTFVEEVHDGHKVEKSSKNTAMAQDCFPETKVAVT